MQPYAPLVELRHVGLSLGDRRLALLADAAGAVALDHQVDRRAERALPRRALVLKLVEAAGGQAGRDRQLQARGLGAPPGLAQVQPACARGGIAAAVSALETARGVHDNRCRQDDRDCQC